MWVGVLACCKALVSGGRARVVLVYVLVCLRVCVRGSGGSGVLGSRIAELYLDWVYSLRVVFSHWTVKAMVSHRGSFLSFFVHVTLAYDPHLLLQALPFTGSMKNQECCRASSVEVIMMGWSGASLRRHLSSKANKQGSHEKEYLPQLQHILSSLDCGLGSPHARHSHV